MFKFRWREGRDSGMDMRAADLFWLNVLTLSFIYKFTRSSLSLKKNVYGVVVDILAGQISAAPSSHGIFAARKKECFFFQVEEKQCVFS